MLHFWLSHAPNYDEVTTWYLGWKAAFPPALLSYDRIKRQFNTALNMMNTAVEGAVPPLPTAATGPPPAAAAPMGGAFASRWAGEADVVAAAEAQARESAAAAAAARGLGVSTPSASELTLRDLVQRYAEEHSISFMPKFGRFQDGLQVSLGRVCRQGNTSPHSIGLGDSGMPSV